VCFTLAPSPVASAFPSSSTILSVTELVAPPLALSTSSTSYSPTTGCVVIAMNWPALQHCPRRCIWEYIGVAVSEVGQHRRLLLLSSFKQFRSPISTQSLNQTESRGRLVFEAASGHAQPKCTLSSSSLPFGSRKHCAFDAFPQLPTLRLSAKSPAGLEVLKLCCSSLLMKGLAALPN